jgi:hypothetical protein
LVALAGRCWGFFLFFWAGVDFGDQLQKFFGILPDYGLVAAL